MKFKAPIEGDYDPSARQFTISGQTVAGNRSSVTLPVTPTPEEFVVWVAQCLGEKFDGGRGVILNTDKLSVAMHPVSDGLAALVITVEVAGMPLSFVLPARNLTPERHKAIGEAIQGALAMIQQADSGAPSH